MDGWDAVATAAATVGAAAGLCYCASAGGDRSAQDRGCILVPGGAGYIGSHAVRELVREGYRVVVVDSLINGKSQAVDPAATFERVCLSDREALNAVFAKHKPLAVIGARQHAPLLASSLCFAARCPAATPPPAC